MGDQRRLKRCSTSTTDVEADGDYETQKQQKKHKKSDLKKVEADADYETQKQKKKQKKTDLKEELKKLRKSFKEMTKTIKGLQETLLTKADRQEISVKNENPTKKVDPLMYECNFASEDAKGNNETTLIVRGFDTSLPRAEIKRALSEHFSSCGEVKRVFVPIECLTGVSKGYALVDMKEDHRKALRLSGSLLGGLKLMVMMAKHTSEYYGYPNFRGCHRCCVNPCIAINKLYNQSNWEPHWDPNFPRIKKKD